MKKTMIFSLAMVTILWAGSMCTAQEKAPAKRRGNQNKASAQRQANRGKASAEQKAWQEKLKKMTPEQQQVARAKKAFEASVSSWRAVRQIAAKEKAKQTLAAIDKIIAAKQQQFNRRLASMEKGEARPRGEARKQAGKKAGRQGRAKKKAEVK